MSLLDYSSPDVVYGDAEIVDYDPRLGIVVLRSSVGRLIAIKVFATRENKSHIFCQRYYTWDCTHEFRGRRCAYAPGHEDMPPLPGQHCHNCGGLRAELMPMVSELRLASIRDGRRAR